MQPLASLDSTEVAAGLSPPPAAATAASPPPATVAASRGEERDLVRRAQSGCAEARRVLAQRLRPVALRLAFQIAGSRDSAHDLTQEAMIRFFANLQRFDAARPLLPWLRSIVRNGAVDQFRRARIRRAESIDHFGVEDTPLELVENGPAPDTVLARRRLRQRLGRCLRRLTHKQREILLLRDYQDLAYREIAETLDIPLGTVMSRLHTARRALRHVLVEAGVGPAGS